jgi:hypothetical protein
MRDQGLGLAVEQHLETADRPPGVKAPAVQQQHVAAPDRDLRRQLRLDPEVKLGIVSTAGRAHRDKSKPPPGRGG